MNEAMREKVAELFREKRRGYFMDNRENIEWELQFADSLEELFKKEGILLLPESFAEELRGLVKTFRDCADDLSKTMRVNQLKVDREKFGQWAIANSFSIKLTEILDKYEVKEKT